jgi:hypothetical protein
MSASEELVASIIRLNLKMVVPVSSETLVKSAAASKLLVNIYQIT